MVCFAIVEELLGKFQIWLGKNIIAENLKNEIALSPMNDELKKAKLTLMMDGGWDQRASGKASTVPLDVTCLSELGQTKWWH
jgi:hypothetical protein